MKKIICLLISCIFCMTSISSYAAPEVSITAACASSTSTLNLSGTISGTRENMVYILISNSDASVASASQLSDMESQIFLSAAVDSDGRYNETLILPMVFRGGYYKAKAMIDGASAIDKFEYINPNTLEIIASELNACGMSDGSVMAVMDSRYSDLLIDPAFYNASKDLVCAIIAANGTNGYNKDSLNETLYGAFAAYELKKNTPIADVFSDYLNVFMDYDTDFDTLKDYVKAALPAYLASANYLSGTFRKIYNDGIKIVSITAASDYTVAQKYILDNYSSLGVNLSEYNSHNEYNRDLIMQDLYARRSEITSVTGIGDLLDDILDDYTITDSGSGIISTPPPSSGISTDTGGSKLEFDSPSIGQIPGSTQPSLADLYGHWSKTDVEFLVSQGIVSGYPDGTYKPDNQVNRAEYAKMISFLINDIVSASPDVFNDVSLSDWYFEPVSKLSKADIIGGFNGSFMPDNFITREEAAVIIYRLLKYNGFNLTDSHSFDDIYLASDWASEALSLLGGAGLMQGYENKVSPKDILTRGEAAAMISNLIKSSFAEVVK